eukprot:2996027-Prymnesium_polylepis.1
MGMPLWGGVATAAQATRIADNLMAPDMLSDWGFRSTSSLDPRYSNGNYIVPCSNWRAPPRKIEPRDRPGLPLSPTARIDATRHGRRARVGQCERVPAAGDGELRAAEAAS